MARSKTDMPSGSRKPWTTDKFPATGQFSYFDGIPEVDSSDGITDYGDLSDLGEPTLSGSSPGFGKSKKYKKLKPFIVGKRRVKRAPTRTIIRWNNILDREILLTVVHVSNYLTIRIPWDEIAKVMGRGISEGAIIQHLAKIRVHHAKNGYPVPPRLIRGGAKIMANSCKPEMESILKGKGPKYALGTYATGSGIPDFMYDLKRKEGKFVDAEYEEDQATGAKLKKRKAYSVRQMQKRPKYADETSDNGVIQADDDSEWEDVDDDYCSEDGTPEQSNEGNTVAAGAGFLEEIDEATGKRSYSGKKVYSPITFTKDKSNLFLKLPTRCSMITEGLKNQNSNSEILAPKPTYVNNPAGVSFLSKYGDYDSPIDGPEAVSSGNLDFLGAQSNPTVMAPETFNYSGGTRPIDIRNSWARQGPAVNPSTGIAAHASIPPTLYSLDETEIPGHNYELPYYVPQPRGLFHQTPVMSDLVSVNPSNALDLTQTFGFENTYGHDGQGANSYDSHLMPPPLRAASMTAANNNRQISLGSIADASNLGLQGGSADEYFDTSFNAPKDLMRDTNTILQRYDENTLGVGGLYRNELAHGWKPIEEATEKATEEAPMSSEPVGPTWNSAGPRASADSAGDNAVAAFPAISDCVNPAMLQIHPVNELDTSSQVEIDLDWDSMIRKLDEAEEFMQAQANLLAAAGVVAATGVVPDAGVVADVGVIADADLAAGADLVAGVGVVADADIEANAGFVADTDLVADADIEANAGFVADTDLVADADIEANAGFVAETDLVADADFVFDADFDVDADFDIDADFEVDPDYIEGLDSAVVNDHPELEHTPEDDK